MLYRSLRRALSPRYIEAESEASALITQEL